MVGHHDLYRIITPFEGCYDRYSSVSEFKEYLTAEYLSSEKCQNGWVFWAPVRYDEGYEFSNIISDNAYGRSIREKIRRVLTRLMSSSLLIIDMVQFWASKEVGGRSILTISDQPFAVSDHLGKGKSWYRKKCMEHQYIVDNGAEKEQLGPPGRVFRNGRPESSPDLRFYSVKEFPLRDHAASCGEISYLALPVFDLHHNQYVGVLEFVSCIDGADILFDGSKICHELEVVEMRTTHLNDWEQLKDGHPETKNYPLDCDRLVYHHQQPNEIIEMLELASKAIPQLHLALVMVPCQRCGNRSNSFNCMKLVASIIKNGHHDNILHDFFVASKFHNLQNGQGIGGFALSSANKSCFCQNVSDFSIFDYQTAHYAQVARLSFCFAICLRNMNHRENNNDLYVFEFFLQPQSRDPTNIWFVLRLLLKIMEDTLKGFKLATGRQLAEKLIADEIRRKYMSTSPKLGQNNIFPFGFEVIPYGLENLHQHHISFLVPMERCDESYSIFKLREHLQKPDLLCLESTESEHGYICYSMENDELLENGGNHYSISEFLLTIEKLKSLMKKFISESAVPSYLMQFWAPKTIKNRLYLSTSDQPFALGYLGRGLCWYRKQCMEHLYYVGDGAKEEELGPPGRVFLTGHLESSPDLRLYSAREFPLLVHVVHCCAREYWALPLFDSQRKYCLGILECIGLPYDLEYVLDKLKEMNLRYTHANCDLSSTNIDDGRKQAIAEIQEMFKLLADSPQIRLAFAWKTCSQCANMNIETFCMERVCDIRLVLFGNWKFQKVNIGKGVAGRVLESENMFCYFENLGDFSILDYPWAHDAQENRFESCFVICLRSSRMESDLYVLEFFINPGSNRDGYPWSYLSFLLSTMKRNLKSFKVASGQQLGEHLLSQSTGYGEKDQFLFKTVRHGHEIDQMKIFEREQNIIGTNSNEGNKRDESKTSFRISYKDLEPHFGKRLEDAANDLGVSRSTLKRARKECGIRRWPSNVKNKKNPFLFQTKTSNKYVQNLDPQISKASSSNLPISDYPIESNVPQTCIATTREVDKTCQENKVVTIKAKFKEDIVKFDLCLSSGLEKLVEEVAKRLHLLPGNFKLKYKDDDDDLILLTCDEDLHNHVKSMRSLGKTTVHVLVHLVSN